MDKHTGRLNQRHNHFLGVAGERGVGGGGGGGSGLALEAAAAAL